MTSLHLSFSNKLRQDMKQNPSNSLTVFDKLHQHIILYWRYLLTLAIVIVAVISAKEIQSQQFLKYEQTQAERYQQYLHSSRAQQTIMAEENKKLSYSSNHLIMALWESKYLSEQGKYNESIEWLNWSLSQHPPHTIAELIELRLMTLCYEINSEKCIIQSHQKLKKSSLAPLADLIVGLQHADNNQVSTANKLWKSAISTTQDPLLKLLLDQNIKNNR